MQKWEYITIRQSSSIMGGAVHYYFPDGKETQYSGADSYGKNIHQLLNQFGDQGYELVDSATAAYNAGIFNTYWILKRAKA